jgi:hypothetical protein
VVVDIRKLPLTEYEFVLMVYDSLISICRICLEKLIVAQLVKKLPFMEPENPLPCSRMLRIGHVLSQLNPLNFSHPISVSSILILSYKPMNSK